MSGEILRLGNIRIVARDGAGAETVIVDDIDLSLYPGEIVGVIGESGAGKTTLGLAALGYSRRGCAMIGGTVHFADQNVRVISRTERRKLRGRRIAYVAQSAAASFNPAKTILWQVCEMPIRYGLAGPAQAREDAIALFRELELPSPETFGARYPHQVSGGQLQRAMLAMAMSCRPDVLVFDEPTTALDVTTQVEVLQAIRKLIRDHHTAGLYISHDLAVVAQVAQRIMVLRAGKLVEIGATQQILDAPTQAYTQQLLSVRKVAADRVVSLGAPSTILETDGVNVSYGTARAVSQASIALARGETLAIVGESGSGKTTLARVICGLKAPESGEVRLAGKVLAGDLRRRTRDELRRIQLIYQMPDTALNPSQRVSQTLERPLRFYHDWPQARIRDRVRELLDLMSLPQAVLGARPSELSGGQKQRVCIARALAAEPDVIVCDEVTSALDALVADEILTLLEEVQRRTGVGYLFITHDLGTVRRVADRVAVMLRGEVIAQGPVAEVFAPPYHPYIAKLLVSVPQMRTDWLDKVIGAST